MGTEWGTGLVTLSSYWLENYDKANEFIALYHYGQNPDIRKVWCQQEGHADVQLSYVPSNDSKTENERRQAAREYNRQRQRN